MENYDIIEKRIRKDVRMSGIFKKINSILVKDDVSEHFVRRIIQDKPVKIVRKGSADKIVGVWTADDEINDFFMKIVGKGKKLENGFVKMFLSVTDEELEKYCKINNIEFTRQDKDKAAQKFVDDVSLKHTDSKHKIIKSLQRLYTL